MSKVSVILTSFNHEKFIQEAIESVLNQTYQDFELIIWDDASSDNSWDLINQYFDARIKAFRNDIQRRALWGINKALSEVASGEYIAIHHSDDVWEPEKLQKQAAFLDTHDEIGAVFTNALAITEDGQIFTDEKHLYFDVFDQPNRTRHEWLRYFFSHGNALCHPSVLIRRKCYDTCGLYRFGLAQTGDFDMWMRLCLKYDIHVLPERLVRFRIQSNEANTSGSRPDSRSRVWTELYNLLKNYLKIESFDELVAVFPEAAKYYRVGGFDLKFVLAMVALEKKPFPSTELIGIDQLFEAVADPIRSKAIKTLYNFDYLDLINLSGKHDIFAVERLFSYDQALTELSNSIIERDGQITNLNQVLNELNGQIAGLNQAANEQISQITDLNQTVEELVGQIINLNLALTDRESQISSLSSDLEQQTADLTRTIAGQEAHLEKILSTRSWKITRPLRFAARLLRGQWGAAFSSFRKPRDDSRTDLMNNSQVIPPEAPDILSDFNTAGQLDLPISAPGEKRLIKRPDSPALPSKSILLVSYYCPSRAHAGGLRILDIYSLIKSEFPTIGLDLYTCRHPEIDWSYDDVEGIFNNIYFSDTDELTVNDLLNQCKERPHYDVIDFQFHDAARHMDGFKDLGTKILFTPIESYARFFFIDVKEALFHSHEFSRKDIVERLNNAIEELKYCRKADEVICVSKPDAAFLRAVSQSPKIKYLESGISDIEFKHALSESSLEITSPKKENIIVYVAFFGSKTNILAMKWYLDNVHPLIKKKIPDYRLHVVGRGDLSVFADYQDEAVIFVGAVPSLGPYINEAKVGIVPALTGSGLRGKMSQYALYGVPSVASPIAVEGSAYEDGVDIYITEVPEIFAERCILLLKDEEINKKIGDKARQTALQNYTWKSKMDIIRKVYALDE